MDQLLLAPAELRRRLIERSGGAGHLVSPFGFGHASVEVPGCEPAKSCSQRFNRLRDTAANGRHQRDGDQPNQYRYKYESERIASPEVRRVRPCEPGAVASELIGKL